MSRRIAIISGGLSLLLPVMAFAMTDASYPLKSGSVNARWEGSGNITADKLPAGILLSTAEGTGSLMTSDLPDFFPQAAILTLTSRTPQTVYFSWTLKRSDQAKQVIPIALGTEADSSLVFSLRSHTGWKHDLTSFGLTLPPHSSVILHDITFQKWSLFEQARFMVSSFWIFDEYRPYSINFVWGPLLATNPHELRGAYQSLPPEQIHATAFFHLVLVLILVIIAGYEFLRGHPVRSRKTILRIAAVLMAAWILFDVRMGSEFLSWVLHDRATYIAADSSTRTFRDRGRFYDFAAAAAPTVADREHYIFLAQQQWPYLGNMRYLTYPSIPGFDVEQDDTWVIYDRPDVSVSDAGQLTIDGEAVTAPGNILMQFDEHSFVFRIGS